MMYYGLMSMIVLLNLILRSIMVFFMITRAYSGFISVATPTAIVFNVDFDLLFIGWVGRVYS